MWLPGLRTGRENEDEDDETDEGSAALVAFANEKNKQTNAIKQHASTRKLEQMSSKTITDPAWNEY